MLTTIQNTYLNDDQHVMKIPNQIEDTTINLSVVT